MTAPISQQTVSVKDPAAIRKRRRRAPAGGAADDCFTCSKRNIKCDRRRPYCSQCLEIGNECSGYKTQLTWGVGVASRGKLRGLSLPIAKAPPVAREPKKSPVSRPISRPRADSNVSTAPAWREHDDSRGSMRRPIDIPSTHHHHHHHHHPTSTPTPPAYPIPGYDYLSMSHPGNTPPMHQGSWGSMAYSPSIVHSPDMAPRYTKFPLHLSTDALSSSVDSVGSEVDYLSPLSQSYPREEIPFSHSPTVLYDAYPAPHSSPIAQSPPSVLVLDHCRAPTSYPGLVYSAQEPSPNLHSHMDPFESHLGHKLMRECDSLSVSEVDAYGASCGSKSSVWSPSHRRGGSMQLSRSDNNHSQWPALRQPRLIRTNQDLLTKMPFFMDYYKITLAPFMVYIDGPHNPFREHILRLAGDSQSLQHAICALSACNLRMKRRLSLGYNTRELSEKLMAEKQAAEAIGDEQIKDQSLSEEFQHRNLAVSLLNQQLNDPAKSCHDSVLATILLLCHYRMVESGVARFHTQFEGVRKILAMRKSQSASSSKDTAWMEMLFTYFDAISASINDREAQLAPGFEGVSPDVQNLATGAENMVGCDRRLFKIIGKLGRLNLLSQHRPVQVVDGSPQQQVNVNVMTGPRFDGNGFGTVLNDDEMLASATGSSTSFDDNQYLFWQEWKEIRHALQSWQFDALAIAASLPATSTPGQVRDLGSVSEAFRYAALIYTERLASPNLPSTHANFQNLVTQVVCYAASLDRGSTAEKFLLWPLFVAGSECVNGVQQDAIRNKCRDIMSRSGYMNNLAALDVLEKLWSGDIKNDTRLRFGRGAPFNWAKCLGGPGAGVEWIMF
ncbi:hypothetical protein PT974_07057 [Cladobotryum mycophilum]|uniref:Zn(2)-C6 fungal-type domain-containing protein n=1 Tax=Cladobotryum mycophilum TaxID=491253 RepID=A0ABR0SNE2_9HYPO